MMMPAEFLDTSNRPIAFRIGHFFININANRILSQGQEIKIEPKVMEVLRLLIDADGATVGKSELLQKVWDEALVTENSLTQAISKLRKILEDEGGRQVIETISKKGYRLAVPVEPIYNSREVDRVQTPETRKQRHQHFKLVYSILLIAGIVFIGLYFNRILMNATASIKVLPKLRPLTTAPGIERHASFFGNDSFIVFSRDSLPIWSVLYTRKISTGKETRILSGLGVKRYPRVLESGKQIVFARKTKDATAIFSVPLAGGHPEEIARLVSGEIEGLDTSPKGDWIVYADRHVMTHPQALFRMDLNKNKLTQLTTPPRNYIGDKLPAISPDGHQIAFARVDENLNEDIYIQEIKSGLERRITTHNLRIFGLDWSADSEEILYCLSDPEEAIKLMKIAVSDNSIDEVLTSIEYVGNNLAVSQSGDKVAFERWSYSTDIYRISLESLNAYSNQIETLVPSTHSDWNPQYSPDGEKIAFISDRSGIPEIWILDKNDQSPKRYAEPALTYRSSPPRWSPDGSQIAIDGKLDGKSNIYLLNLKTGASNEIVTGGVSPNFSRDGKWLYYSSHQNGNWEIWKIHLFDKEKIQVTSNGGYLADESFDGSHLYFSKVRQAGLWRQHIKSGGEEMVVANLEFADRFNWLVTREGIYYIRREANYRPVLYFLDFAKANSERIVNLDAGPHTRTFGLSLSPDRRQVLFSQANKLDSDIMWIDYPH